MTRFFFCAMVVLAVWGNSAAGQNPFLQRGQSPEDVFLLAPRPLMRLLREGETSLSEGRYTDGIQALGALLQEETEGLPVDLRGQDFFSESGKRGLFNKTVRGEAIRLLADLPAAGRKVLEIEFGIAARRQLDEAVSASDFTEIAEVARRFPHTEAGYEAQLLVAQQKLNCGFPLAAAAIYDRLLTYPTARDLYGVELARAAAVAWQLANDPERAAGVLSFATRCFPGGQIEWNGRLISLDSENDWNALVFDPLEAYRARRTDRNADDWLLTGGTAARNATSRGSMPLKHARWVKDIHSSVPEKEDLQNLAESESQGERIILPRFEVRAIGDLVLTKTTDSEILAVDFESGLTKWPFYHDSSPAKLLDRRTDYTSSSGGGLSQQLQNRVWGSSAFGRFSCDQDRLYYISDETVEQNGSSRAYSQSITNVLQGVSLSGQGKIEWKVGGGKAENTSEPRLREAFFLGPPLSYQGDLYAIIEQNNETRLVVLDPASGKLRWSQQLIHPLYRQLRFDPLRRAQAISPTISDGVVLCPTGAGAVLAVDLLSRSLLWGYSYTTENSPRRQAGGAFGGIGGLQFNPLAPRWVDAAMIAQDGIVVVSPPESSNFFVRNILTGESVMPPQRRNSSRYVAGIYDGHAIVVAERYVYSLDIATQVVLWEREYPERLKLAGKGLWQQDRLLLPLTDQRLIQIHLHDGAILENAEVDQPVGNLFAHRGDLISASPTSVAVYRMQDALRIEVDQRLNANPEDVWALNQSSQLALADGEIESAYETLWAAYQLEPRNIDTRYLLVETLLSGLQTNFDGFEQRARELQNIVVYGPQRFRFLQWLALGSMRSGKYRESFESLLSLMRLRIGTQSANSQNRAHHLKLSESYAVDTDTWIATELARTYENADAADQAVMDSMVRSEIQSVEGVVIPLRRQRLKYFRWHPSAESQVLETAISLLAKDDQSGGEELLQPLLHSRNVETREAALGLLSRRTLQDNLLFGPRGQAFPSVFDRTNAAMNLESVVDPADVPEELMRPIEWHRGQFAVDVLDQQRLYPSGSRLPQVSERYGRPEIDVRLSGELLIVSNSNGEDIAHFEYKRASADLSDLNTQAYIRGGLIIIETSSEVIGLDLYRGLTSGSDAMLWRQSLLHRHPSPNSRFRQPDKKQTLENSSLGVVIRDRSVGGRRTAVGPLTPAGLILQLANSVVAIDAYTGRQLWVRDGYDDKIRFASEGIQLAIVNPSLGETEIVDCRDGTVLDRQRYSGDWQHLHAYQDVVVEFREIQSERSQGIVSAKTKRPVLRVWNAISGKEIAGSLELSLGSRAEICDGRYLVALDPKGKMHVFDFREESHSVLDVPVDLKLATISVERFGKILVIASSSGGIVGQPGGSSQPTSIRHINGRVYALDLQRKRLLWEEPGRLHNMLFPLSQPRNSPFMVTFRVRRGRMNSNSATIAVIDLRTGRLTYADDEVRLRGSAGFAMQLVPRIQTVEFTLGSTSFVVRPSAPVRPPQPVFDFGRDTKRPSAEVLEDRLNLFR